MTPDQIAARLAECCSDAIVESLPDQLHPCVHTAGSHWRALAQVLRHDAQLNFDWLGCITAVDYIADEELAAVYDLRSMAHEHRFAVKVFVDRQSPTIPSVVDLWPAADWHEREAFDLMGIVFEGHPDLRRILLPEDWVGSPLRKDYEYPREYHGIPGTYETDWQQKPDYP
jgi:NADH-quinone oxidoreductase subunit C